MARSFSLSKLKQLAAAAVLAFAPVSASALTVTPGTFTDASQGTGTIVNAAFTGNTFDLEWSDALGGFDLARMFYSFTADEAFRVVLKSYSSATDATNVRLLDGAQTSGSSPQLFSTPARDSRVGDFLSATVFGPGTYTFRVNESNGDPVNGSLSLLVAPIPLPAGLALMVTALGGLVLVRRRRSSAAA